ncbi:MAG: hypothetical protein V3V10_04350 [Planctomycetota bacterium]
MIQIQNRVNFETTAAFQPVLVSKGLIRRKLFMAALVAILSISLLLSTGTTVSADVPITPLEERNQECPQDKDFEPWAKKLEEIADRAEAAAEAGDHEANAAACLEYLEYIKEHEEEIAAAEAAVTECKRIFIEPEWCALQSKKQEIAEGETKLAELESALEEAKAELKKQESRKLELIIERDDRLKAEEFLKDLEFDLVKVCTQVDLWKLLFAQAIKDHKEAAQEHADAKQDELKAEIALAYATLLAWNYYRYVWLPAAAAGPVSLIVHIAMAVLVLAVLIATVELSIAKGKRAKAKKKLKDARKQRKDIANELAELKREKKRLKNNIAQMKKLLSAMRPYDEIVIELHEVCEAIERLKDDVVEGQEKVRIQKIEIADMKREIPDLEKAIEDACEYFWENVAPNAPRFAKAKARISALWGI